MITMERDSKDAKSKSVATPSRNSSSMSNQRTQGRTYTDLNTIETTRKGTNTEISIKSNTSLQVVAKKESSEEVTNSTAKLGVPQKEKVTAKNATFVVVYCLIVAMLVSIIAFNANALSLSTEKNAELANTVTQLSATKAELTSELNAIEDPVRLQNLANQSLELTSAESTIATNYVMTPTIVDLPEVVQQTNWFDTFCDSVNSVIGG